MARAARNVSRETFTPAPGAADVDIGGDQAIVGGVDGEDSGLNVDGDGDELSQQIAREDKNDWDLPPEDRGKDAPEPRRERRARDREETPTEELSEDEEEVRLAYDESERGYEERRGRRSRRNRSRREALTGRDQEIEQLKHALTQQSQYLQRLTGGQMGLAARDLEARITYARNAIDMADAELGRAIKESDGDAYTKISRARDEAQKELWQLETQQRNLEETARRTFAEGGRTDQNNGADREQPQLSPDQQRELARREADAARFAEVFQDRYSWFDPQQRGGDNDVVHEIDQELIAEGYLPHTKAFWHQMEDRMREEGFRPNEDDDEDERPARRRPEGAARSRASANGGRPPTSGRGGTRRDGRGGGGFQLTEVETNMLRDEGLLESNLAESDLARRDRIIGKWRVGRERLRRAGLDQ